VKDVEQSIEFYRKLFGIEPSKVRTGYAKFDVQNPPLNFTLNEGAFSSRGALSHMGIQVRSTEDVLTTRQRWAEAGLLTRDEMQTSCCYAMQDKTWVRDPDGNEWEVFVVLEDNLAETAPCECGDTVVSEINAAATSCCAPAPVGISSNT
jgi:catechol 2,3-dioxygenase-like lactoylglutathione lyase family enzyme